MKTLPLEYPKVKVGENKGGAVRKGERIESKGTWKKVSFGIATDGEPFIVIFT